MIQLAVFSTRGNDGKQFIIPGLWYNLTDPDDDATSIIFNVMTYSVILNLEKKWVEVETDTEGRADLPHHEERLCHRGLAHGSIKILVLENPL
jgi:hypothetical protein